MLEKAKLLAPYPFISRIEAAKFLCVSVQQIDKYVLCGTLTPLRVGRKVIFRRSQLEQLLTTNSLPVLPRLRIKKEKSEVLP